MGNKKLMIFAGMLALLFIVHLGNLSAQDFTAVKTYDEVKREVTIMDSSKSNEEIGKLTLYSNPVQRVGRGYQQVAEFRVESYKDINNLFEDLKLYNKSEKDWLKHPIKRSFDIKIKEWGNKLVEEYELVCTNESKELIKEGNETNEVCESVFVRSYYVKDYEWVTLTTKEITKEDSISLSKDNSLTIGIFAIVEKDDHVEWIPTLYGIEIEEWAEWEQSLNVDLIHYYKLDDGDSTTVIDEIGNANGTKQSDEPVNVSGKINSAYDFSTKQHINYSNSLTNINLKTSPLTLNLWIKLSSASNYANHFTSGLDSQGGWAFVTREDDAMQITKPGVTVDGCITSDNVLTKGTWQMVTMVNYGNGTNEIWVDGVRECTGNITQDYNSSSSVGNIGSHAINLEAEQDEIGVWTRALSGSEISDLYNSGDGITYNKSTKDNPPVVTLNSPTVNANYITLQNITINCTASDDIKLDSVKLLINDVINSTNASGINNTDYLFSFLNLADGNYIFKCRAEDNASQTTDSSTVTIDINTTPQINFTAPTFANNTNLTSNYIPVQVSVTETYFKNLTFYFYVGDVLNETITFENETRFYNKTGCLCANWKVNATICTTTEKCSSTNTRYYLIDLTPPFVEEEGLENLTTYSLPVNSSWQINASDTNLFNCYYNTSDNEDYTIVTCNSTFFNTTWTTEGEKIIQYCANDSFGNENCLEKEIKITYLNITTTQDKDTAGEGMNVRFTLRLGVLNTPSTDATLMFNNTNYGYDSKTTSTDYHEYIKTILISEGWGNSSGIVYDLYWNYTIDSYANETNTTIKTLTTFDIALDDCSDYTDVILNLSLKDEEENALVNATAGANIELDLYISAGGIEYQYSAQETNENNLVVCMPSGLLNDSSYQIDFTIGFDSTDRINEFYYLDNGTLNSSSSFDARTNKVIDLMNLKTADKTSFLFNFFDEDNLPVENAIVHVYRKYIGDGIFKEVGRAKTDDSGDATINLVEEDVIYYFQVTKEGELLYTSTTLTALCQTTPCSILLSKAGDYDYFDTNWNLTDKGYFTFNSYPSTRIVNLTYRLDDLGTFNVTIWKSDYTGEYSHVDDFQGTGTSGSITGEIPQSAGNTTFYAVIYLDGDYVTTKRINLDSRFSDTINVTLALFLSILIILTLGLMATTEGVKVIVFLIVGLFLSASLGLIVTELSTGISVLIYLLATGGLLIWKINSRGDR